MFPLIDGPHLTSLMCASRNLPDATPKPYSSSTGLLDQIEHIFPLSTSRVNHPSCSPCPHRYTRLVPLSLVLPLLFFPSDLRRLLSSTWNTAPLYYYVPPFFFLFLCLVPLEDTDDLPPIRPPSPLRSSPIVPLRSAGGLTLLPPLLSCQLQPDARRLRFFFPQGGLEEPPQKNNTPPISPWAIGFFFAFFLLRFS